MDTGIEISNSYMVNLHIEWPGQSAKVSAESSFCYSIITEIMSFIFLNT